MFNETPPSRIEVYRHELKFFIDRNDHKIFSEIFRSTMQPDPNGNRENEYWIRSLYFDTVDNDDFYEKVMGVNRRKKIRLRLYDVRQQKIKIEIKNRFNEYMMKETAQLDREEAAQLLAGNREILLGHKNETLNRVYYFLSREFYRPSVIVDYEREAYIYPIQNIRVTFDKNIRTNNFTTNIFDRDLGMIPVFEEDTMVMEIKYTNFLPDWLKKILSGLDAERYAISKYCLSKVKY